MVKETRHIFELSDIKAIRLKCSHCKREAVQSFEDTEVPKRCPFCHEDWEIEGPSGQRGMTYHAIRDLKNLLIQEGNLVTIRFEIEGEAEPR